MIMKKELFLSLLLFIMCSTHATAQTYYYDSYAKKINITLNEDRFLVNVLTDSDNWQEITKRILANVQPLFKASEQDLFSVYISRKDYEKLTSLNFWEEDAKSVIVTPGLFKEGDSTEIIFYPRILVTLYKAADIDLLTSYIEKYNLIIDRIFEWPWDNTVSYILRLTMDSEIGTIECANEIFESGNFKYSYPDTGLPRWGGYDSIDIPSITSSPTETSSEIYDLQGRKLTSKPAKGIYIQQGKKKFVESR